MMPAGWNVLSLHDVNLLVELPETGTTLEENAVQKARYVFERTHIPSLADDSGLEVAALDGRPGVHSAYYAGTARDASANMARLLRELDGTVERQAVFRTVLAYIDDAGTNLFDGRVEGAITTEQQGVGGFGYDPIFKPLGADRTFAAMDLEVKNSMSHRGRAMKAFLDHLSSQCGPVHV